MMIGLIMSHRGFNMSKKPYLQSQIEEKVSRKYFDDRGREYYWVKPISDEVYHGKPYDSKYSPKGHERAEDLAKKRSQIDNTKVEVLWTSGPWGLRYHYELSNWRSYKTYTNGNEIK